MENTEEMIKDRDRHTEKAAQTGEILHLMGTAIEEQTIQLSRGVKAQEAGHMLFKSTMKKKIERATKLTAGQGFGESQDIKTVKSKLKYYINGWN